MSEKQLKVKLDTIKKSLQAWYKELDEYKTWALENDGVIDKEEQAVIDNYTEELTSISLYIAKLERQKGIAEPAVAPESLTCEMEAIKKELEELEKELR